MSLCVEYHWYCDACCRELTSIHMAQDIQESLRALRLQGWAAKLKDETALPHTFHVTCPQCAKEAKQQAKAGKETA